MQRFILFLSVCLIGLASCHRTAVDPAILTPEITVKEPLRPIYLSSKVVDNQLQIAINPQGPIVCCCAPCIQASYPITERYEVQIAATESGPYQPYKTIKIGGQEKEQLAKQTVTLPDNLTSQPVIVRVVAIGKNGEPGYSRAIMNSTSPVSASVTEVAITETDKLLSLTFNPVRQQVVYVTFVQDASLAVVPTLRLADYSNGQLLNKRVLTPGGLAPVFSRDGKQLAYLLPYQSSSLSKTLVIQDVEANTNRLILLSKEPWVSYYTWSPDGQWIAFLEQTNEYTRLWKINVADGKEEAITPAMPYKQAGGLWQSAIDWAPDGNAIVASRSARTTDTDWRFGFSFVSPANGAFLTDIQTLAGWTDKNPSYSPDGQNLAFVSNRTDPSSNLMTLWIRNLTTNQLRHVRLPDSYQLADSVKPQWLTDRSLMITANSGNPIRPINLIISL